MSVAIFFHPLPCRSSPLRKRRCSSAVHRPVFSIWPVVGWCEEEVWDEFDGVDLRERGWGWDGGRLAEEEEDDAGREEEDWGGGGRYVA